MTPELKQQIEQEAKSYASSFGYFPGSSEDEDMQSAYITGAKRYTDGLEAATTRANRYEKALKAIQAEIAKAEKESIFVDEFKIRSILTNALTPKTSTNDTE